MNEQALKERLKYIANAQNRSFNEVLKKLILERFLYRLSMSKYNEKFIFKGGLLLSYYLPIGRETMDVDFLAKRISADRANMVFAFEEICKIDAQDDFDFSFKDIELLDHNHMNYEGFRISILANFENIKDIIKIDIGVGDIVSPNEKLIDLSYYKKIPLFEESVTLQVYPVETIFSEKLETIVSRGAANSRMKDFHDILLLCRSIGLIDSEKLRMSIIDTFANRATEIDFPIYFEDHEYQRLSSLWTNHRRSLAQIADELLLPIKIEEVVIEINARLENLNIGMK